MENLMWVIIEIVFSAITVALAYYFVGAILNNKGVFPLLQWHAFWSIFRHSSSAFPCLPPASRVKTSSIDEKLPQKSYHFRSGNTPKRNIRIVIKFFTMTAAFALTFVSGFFLRESIIFVILATVLVSFFFGLIFFRSNIFGASIAAFFTIMAGMLSELMAVFLIAIFQGVVVDYVVQYTLYHVQGRVLLSLIMMIFVVLIRHFRKGSMSATNTKTMLALCIMPLVSVLLINQYVIHFVGLPDAPTVSEIFPIVSIAVANIFIFVFFEIAIRQNEKARKLILIEAQNMAQQQHIKRLMENQNEIRTITHDFRQQVHELYTLCAEKQYDILLTKLAELSERRSKNILIDTGNTMLDSILTSKIEIAEKQKINFKRELDVEPELSYIESEICVLLGNALDNAIEACLRSENGEKFIGMELTATPKQFLCHIINTLGTIPQAEGEFLKTSKGDRLRHGVGLQSMSQICENLGGEMTYSYNEKHFNIWLKFIFTDAEYVE